MHPTPCPTREDLAALLAGQLSGDALEAVASHLDQCPRCQARAADFDAGPDPLLSGLRHPPAENPFIAEPQCQEAVARFQEMSASAGFVNTTHDQATPPVAEAAALSATAARLFQAEILYRHVRPHARGGLGEVHVVCDEGLHREVALKHIQDRWADDPDSRRRFLLEAEITGRLEHPGVVPVYSLLHGADGRPCYAMRFIQGETLKEAAERFHQADRPGRDLGERRLALRQLLSRFIAVCNTMAYAHSRGIVHRDLKPANIMLGKYGETLVVDWGLAKAVARDETARSGGEDTLAPTSSGDSGGTEMGKAVGTPQYMSPEQAAGRWDLVGPASDIYSLGATFYFLLTGRPPFAGESGAVAPGALLERVKRGEFPRLRQVKARISAALEAVCLKAMAYQPEARYQTALELAADLEHWLGGEPVTAYREPWAVRSGRWMRRHRTMVTATAAALAVSLLLGAAGGLWLQWHEAERRAEAARRDEELRQGVTAALDKVEDLQRRGRWSEAAAVLAEAERRLGEAGPADLRRRLVDARADVDLVGRLEIARALAAVWKPTGFDNLSAARAYTAALRDAGLLSDHDGAAAVAARIRDCRVRGAVVAALDDLASIVEEDWRNRLLDVLRQADPHPWRDRFRDPALRRDPLALKQLAAGAKPEEHSPELLAALGKVLGLGAEAVPVLEAAQRRYPADFWVNYWLAFSLWKADRPADAVGYYRAALAVRPEATAAYNNLGLALRSLGRHQESIVAYQQALALDPRHAPAQNNLAVALLDMGRAEEALAASQKALAIHPNLAAALANRGNALRHLGRLDDAIASYKQALVLDPRTKDAHFGLAHAWEDKGEIDEAIRCYRAGVALDPKNAVVLNNLGALLCDRKGDYHAAVAVFQQALELAPNQARTHYNLGNALQALERLEEAVGAYRRAIELEPRNASACMNLGTTLHQMGRMDEAIAAHRQAVALSPNDPAALTCLGNALRQAEQLDEAVSRFQQAIRIDPAYPNAHGALGQALVLLGRYQEAKEATQRALDYLPKGHAMRSFAGRQLERCERLLALEKRLPGLLAGRDQPEGAEEAMTLAEMCGQHQKDYAAAARFYGDAFAAAPKLADDLATGHRYQAACYALLAATGKGRGADKLSAADRTTLREQARAWLQAELTAWTKQVEKEPARASAEVQRTLQHWQKDPDLASVRDDKGLAQLPPAERDAWKKLWADVRDLLKKTTAQK
jgi:tetratricopeptide (TPR) repeat protein/tRNA A-37 threonylcarbamoyl transferase component Bud32